MRIQRFGHAGIEVGNLAAAETFYADVFGFSVVARFPDDGEVMFAVGDTDHLLLHSTAADRTGSAGSVRGASVCGGLNHAAFQLTEGHREISTACERLTALGVEHQVVDHDGDASVYFRDPDGNRLEIYAAPGSTPRFATPGERTAAAARFVYANARPIDRAIFEHRYRAAPAQRVLAALEGYRNADGGFGHALEPDVRGPASQPIHTLTALELLREAGIRSPELAGECSRFLGTLANDEAAIPALLPSALDYPAAAHWQGPFAVEPSLSWTMGLVAQLTWHGARHPWAQQARQACMSAVHGQIGDEAHHLLYLVRFAGDVLEGDGREQLLGRCRGALSRAAFFVAETPVSRYGLTPLHYAPHPDAPMCRRFDENLVTAHLDDLLESQQGDGGWPIRFEAPGGAARLEWRGRWTLEALAVLGAYGRLP